MSKTLATLLAAALTVLAPAAQAQFAIPPRGAAETFDVASWNLEFFGEPQQGPNDMLQAERVQAVLEAAQIDLWGFQEVVSTAGWVDLLTALQDDGYSGVLGPSVGSGQFNQRLAYLYDTSVVEVISTGTVLSGNEFDFANRLPFQMVANVSVGGATREVTILDIHAKASSDVNSYNRRVAASATLKAYTDGLRAEGRSVIVLGDYNDELTVSTSSGRPSPYLNFGEDATYVFATRRLNDQNIATFCGNSSTCTGGSTLDHIAFTGPILADYVEGSGDRYGELPAAIAQYNVTTSDHLPVLGSFRLGTVAGESGPDVRTAALLPAAPNPFRTATTLRFRLEAAGDVQIEVVDLLGRTVARVGGAYGAGAHQVALDGSGMAAGPYRVRLTAGGDVQTQTIVRAR